MCVANSLPLVYNVVRDRRVAGRQRENFWHTCLHGKGTGFKIRRSPLRAVLLACALGQVTLALRENKIGAVSQCCSEPLVRGIHIDKI